MDITTGACISRYGTGVYNRSSRTLVFSSGGHPAAPFDRSGEWTGHMVCTRLRTPNLFVGGLSHIEYDQMSVYVPEASRLYVFSDGVFEVEDCDGRMWGYRNFEDFMVLASRSGEPLLERLLNRVTFLMQSRPPDDDFSVFEVKFS